MEFFLILKNDRAMTVDMILMILMGDIKVSLTYIFLFIFIYIKCIIKIFFYRC